MVAGERGVICRDITLNSANYGLVRLSQADRAYLKSDRARESEAVAATKEMYYELVQNKVPFQGAGAAERTGWIAILIIHNTPDGQCRLKLPDHLLNQTLPNSDRFSLDVRSWDEFRWKGHRIYVNSNSGRVDFVEFNGTGLPYVSDVHPEPKPTTALSGPVETLESISAVKSEQARSAEEAEKRLKARPKGKDKGKGKTR